ncbi:ATP-dependent RNA helicase DbpA [Ferrimonas marina]|uniref:DEAD-box ATP-dependent RNA helicase RhpA n=1 Tax=Ferrimonas marina TaxID=299255 RepID=A0A1M5S018_9GAMM|nr:ATP-dependent RNA helicase DbpA [Ferrimonas marina]SHH31648.1 ATP-dependent RNA helicase DbpA [Ferrimonas marina]
MSDTAFSNLNLSEALLANLDTLGYRQMTPIQQQALPSILAGADLVGQARTGSGKTAAFGLGLLARLQPKQFQVQSLVLCPTRELADQVAAELRRLARAIPNIKILSLCGGSPLGPQAASLEHGAHIVVGTPGRIQDHISRETLDLSGISALVLDEADRMLEMGFQDELDYILARLPEMRQTLLFSATFPEEIKQIADSFMLRPVMVKVAGQATHADIEQHFYEVADNDERTPALTRLLLQHQPQSSVVFCNTKKEVKAVAGELHRYGFSVLALHGDLDQRDRDQMLTRFANKSASVLVATDVAARGLDIDDLDAVFNYHIAHDSEVHVHRVGRTGRAGSRGMAFSLFSVKEAAKVARLEDYLGIKIDGEALPPASVLNQQPAPAPMVTVEINGGKKQKLRPGDIVGALTRDGAVAGDKIGKIQVTDIRAFVAVDRRSGNKAVNQISKGKLKGRSFKARLIRD